MARAIAPELYGGLTLSDAQASLLDPSEFELIRQAATSALASGDDCEIEQMMRLRGMLPVRRRIQARPERARDGAITALRIVVERDGDPVLDWRLDRGDVPRGESESLALAAVEAINALTAVVLHAEAVKRHADRGRSPDIADSADHILANVHRAWRHVGSFCRKHAVLAP
ncbi:hypothetical protein [Ancylobacter amanitiformis]|uniref:Uncharacterized protein n=1 Tax=Ancylobacter amanitiformis TaxID=217069 RepID=A0ABU0LW59_9HYPH|nr:hypothetical protein [Ancylobacter amanitiformis]MDQ0512967.1 hypothetical protein [Ancylobacter amanitiformis]